MQLKRKIIIKNIVKYSNFFVLSVQLGKYSRVTEPGICCGKRGISWKLKSKIAEKNVSWKKIDKHAFFSMKMKMMDL